ncbi:MAG TPA: PAS domain-containing protein, partial [Acidimicrobiia bacterium]|nr:PAS domain-containing protein [Acidimicrobiia bacterium]
MQPDSAIPDEGLRQALDAAPDGIAVIGKDGIILFVNQMMERLFEYEHDDLVGLSVDELLPERVRELHVRHRGEYVSHPRTRSMGAGLELRG